MSELNQLVSMYDTEGWKHFEKWLNTMMQESISIIINPKTPIDEVDRRRMLISAYQSIQDKVLADKINAHTADTTQ